MNHNRCRSRRQLTANLRYFKMICKKILNFVIIMRCYWPQNSNLILSHMRDRSHDVVELNLYLNIGKYITKYAYCVLEIKKCDYLDKGSHILLILLSQLLWQIKKHVILPRVNWISFISLYTLPYDYGKYQEMRPIPDYYFKMMW